MTSKKNGLSRTVAFGYRTSELQAINLLPDIPPHSKSLKLKVRNKGYSKTQRCPAMVSAGVHVENVALPRPDFIDPQSVCDGIKKRFGHAPPEVDREFFDEFLAWHREDVKRLTPIPAEETFDFEEWLDGTNFPGWRKEELREAQASLAEMLNSPKFEVNVSKVKSFIKDESYPTWKYPRPINSRTDEYKCLVGPAVKKMEKIVFSDTSYIKKVPRNEWPTFIMEHMNSDYWIYISDYSSYEALFEELMEIEIATFKWLLQYHPMQLAGVLLGSVWNYFHFLLVRGKVWRKRMSGEMWTSFGNGHSTNVFHRFLGQKLFGKEIIIVQEGDDTLYCSPGPIPVEMYAKVGLEVKLERVTDISVAQFCQLIFDPYDLIVVRDPIFYICNFSWLSAKFVQTTKYDQMMLNCRALSALHQYPGHPIIQSFAVWIYRNTKQDADKMRKFLEETRLLDNWHRNQLLEAVDSIPTSSDGGNTTSDPYEFLPTVRPPPEGTRNLVEKRFGIPIEDQIKIENYFDAKETLGVIPLDLISSWVQPSWMAYYDWYVREVDVRDQAWRVIPCGPVSTCEGAD